MLVERSEPMSTLQGALPTQTALVKEVTITLPAPGFSLFLVTRLYTHSRSQMLVLIFHAATSPLKFSGISKASGSTLDAASHCDVPEESKPEKPSPVTMLAPYVAHVNFVVSRANYDARTSVRVQSA